METPFKQSQAFWRSQLEGSKSTAFPSYPSHTCSPVINTSLRHEISVPYQAPMQEDFSIFAIFAWAVLLSTYAATDEVVLGVDLPCQKVNENGLVRTTIPFRVILGNDETLADLWKRLETQLMAMQKHDLGCLGQISKLSDDAKEACNFRTLLRVRSAGAGEDVSKFREENDGIGAHNRSLVLECTMLQGSLVTKVGFDIHLIDHSQAGRILGQFEHLLLQQLKNDKCSKLADLDLVSDGDKSELQYWNKDTPSIIDACLHDSITIHAKQRPSAHAICSWDGDLTFEDLDKLSSQIAVYLAHRGVKKGDAVLLSFEKSKWAPVAVLAVSKAGGICIMLDPFCPKDRLHYLLNEVHAVCVLGTQNCQSSFPNNVFIGVDAPFCEQLLSSDEENLPTIDGNDIFCVVFTSGSTGVPKGCSIEHKAFSSMLKAFAISTHLSPASRVLHYASYSFVGGLAEIVLVLQAGGCLCIPKREQVMNNPSKVVQDMEVNWADLNPGMAELIHPLEARTLKTLLLSGEMLTRKSIEIWAGSTTLLNSYGSTESCSAFVCSPAPLMPTSHPGRIGRPFCGRAWIVDPLNHQRLMPIGAIGELLLEGPGLGCGYLNDPGRTSNAFVKNPSWMRHLGFGSDYRLYRSGDLARYDSDGSLFLLGRKDTQAKLRGQRLELGEVEHHLQSCLHGLLVVADVIKPLDSNTKILVGFVTTQKEARNDTAKSLEEIPQKLLLQAPMLEESLKERLPSYMIPSAYIPILQLPLTQSGKIDRKRIHEFGSGLTIDAIFGRTIVADKTSSATRMEARLLKVWGETLNRRPQELSVQDSFLHLGGDSLRAARLVGLARSAGIRISFADILKHHTIHKQAQVAKESTVTDEQEMYKQIQHLPTSQDLTQILGPDFAAYHDEIEDVAVASDFQISILAGELSKANTEVHWFVLDFRPQLETGNLREALIKFVNHHPAMRTMFKIHRHQIYQVVFKSIAVDLVISTMNSNLKGLWEARLASKMGTNLPGRLLYLVHFTIFENEGLASRLVFRISHALFDGAVFTRFCQELQSIFRGASLTPYLPYSNLVRMVSGVGKEIAYWGKLLGNARNIRLVERTSPSINHPMDSIIHHSIPHPPSFAQDVPLSTFLNVAWALVLSDILVTDDIVFGMYASLRNLGIPEARETAGCCLNIIPVRLKLQPDTTVSALLQTAQEQFIASIPFVATGESTIIQKCTEWPRWDRLSTLLLHKNEDDYNLEQKALQPFQIDDGDRTYTCTGSLPEVAGDYADMEIITVPDSANRRLSLSVYFCQKTISEPLARELIELFSQKISALTSDESAGTTLVSTLRRKASVQFPLVISSHTEREPSSVERNSKPLQLYQKIVHEAWASIFDIQDGDKTENQPGRDPAQPFYINQPLLLAHSLSVFYTEIGFLVSMDEIIDRPSMNDQIQLLAQKSKDNLAQSHGRYRKWQGPALAHVGAGVGLPICPSPA